MPQAKDAKPRKRKGWAASVGTYGHRIRVFEDLKSGILYAEMRDPSLPCGYRSLSLRHTDRDRAVKWAHEQVAQWMAGDEQRRERIPTVALILGLYLRHQTPTKVQSERDADARRAGAWTQFLGPAKDLSKLALREWQSFTVLRRSGAIDANGKAVAPDNKRAVRDGTVAADLVFMISVLNWAAKWRMDDGRYLLHENPARGYPIPNEKNPRRPVVTENRFLAVRATADRVTMVVGRGKNRREQVSYLPSILDLVNGTGRRISAVLALRYEDLKLGEGPHGSIRWPAATDKMKREWTVPISVEVRTAINRVLSERPGIGAAYLFPAVNDPSAPIAIEVVSAWLLKAEALAGLQKQEGSLWHAYRRKWATERKFMPAADVAAAGGWSDQNTLTQIYMQADQATMFRVVSEPAKLMVRSR